MYKSCIELAINYFKNATIVIDKYHFQRQSTWAFENVRKRVQKTMSKKYRRYYKRSRRLLLKPESQLSIDAKEEVDIMLLYSEDLRQAYRLKELFRRFMHSESSKEATSLLNNGLWMLIALVFLSSKSVLTLILHGLKRYLLPLMCLILMDVLKVTTIRLRSLKETLLAIEILIDLEIESYIVADKE